MISFARKSLSLRNEKLFYPSGEVVPINCQIISNIKIGKFSSIIPVLVAEISDECLLGKDFLSSVGARKFLHYILQIPKRCARIKFSEGVPPFLEELFNKDSKDLNNFQKKEFAKLLTEFQDIFTEKIVAGNCELIKHRIETVDSNAIKQVPRRIPFHLRTEVNKIIEDMKEQGVIEESRSPWVSPAVLVKKKMELYVFAWITEN